MISQIASVHFPIDTEILSFRDWILWDKWNVGYSIIRFNMFIMLRNEYDRPTHQWFYDISLSLVAGTGGVAVAVAATWYTESAWIRSMRTQLVHGGYVDEEETRSTESATHCWLKRHVCIYRHLHGYVCAYASDSVHHSKSVLSARGLRCNHLSQSVEYLLSTIFQNVFIVLGDAMAHI